MVIQTKTLSSQYFSLSKGVWLKIGQCIFRALYYAGQTYNILRAILSLGPVFGPAFFSLVPENTNTHELAVGHQMLLRTIRCLRLQVVDGFPLEFCKPFSKRYPRGLLPEASFNSISSKFDNWNDYFSWDRPRAIATRTVMYK